MAAGVTEAILALSLVAASLMKRMVKTRAASERKRADSRTSTAAMRQMGRSRLAVP